LRALLTASWLKDALRNADRRAFPLAIRHVIQDESVQAIARLRVRDAESLKHHRPAERFAILQSAIK
jgi:hypothetical protein